MRAKVIDMQCVKRLEVPEDLVGMLLFLASPASAFITGQPLAVEGGSTFPKPDWLLVPCSCATPGMSPR